MQQTTYKQQVVLLKMMARLLRKIASAGVAVLLVNQVSGYVQRGHEAVRPALGAHACMPSCLRDMPVRAVMKVRNAGHIGRASLHDACLASALMNNNGVLSCQVRHVYQYVLQGTLGAVSPPIA
jgi:hypothetical protein